MIVLASQSPRRHQLLEMLGIPHRVDPAHLDEDPRENETPRLYALRLAQEKAIEVSRRNAGQLVLAADTVVVLGTELLGKPSSAEDARQMLTRMSGRRHDVVTGVVLTDGTRVMDRLDVTAVWFRDLTTEVIRGYVATGDPLDKAGSYGIQGCGAVLVDRIEGDYFGVMGLPLRLVVELLAEAGIPYRFTR